MAKLFSQIATNTNSIDQRYARSTVNQEINTFIELRKTNQPVQPRILITNRPEKVYNQYTDPATISAPSIQTYQESKLVKTEQISRIRRSKFYEGFRIVNSGLTRSNAPVNETFIEIKPYTTTGPDQTFAVETLTMLRDNQTLPIVSGPRDVKRMQLLSRSSTGLSFKLFQQVLQAGNTFGQARAYNPASVEAQTLNYRNSTLYIPLVRESRVLANDRLSNPQYWGRVQKESVIDIQNKLTIKFQGGQETIIPPAQTSATETNKLLESTIQNEINNTNIPLPRFLSDAARFVNRTFGTNVSVGSNVNLGQLNRQLDAIGQAGEAIRRGLKPENSILEPDKTVISELHEKEVWPLVKAADIATAQTTTLNFHTRKKAYLERAQAAIKKVTNLNELNAHTKAYDGTPIPNRSSITYTTDVRAGAGDKSFQGIRTTSYIKDPSNLSGTSPIVDAAQLGSDDFDFIKFKIKVPNVFPNGISFRAFIEDIQHNAKGLYEDVRYVGRPERFVTYKGMSRTITVSLYLIAFSQEEVDGIWTRANMLNKLVFPIDNAGGFMVPPLAIITIGNVITDQPGYVDNVDMRLQDIPWDIDKELPQAIKLNMTFNVIEKVYIQQKDTDPSKYIQLFNEKPITPPPPPTAPTPEPPAAPQPTAPAPQPTAPAPTSAGGSTPPRRIVAPPIPPTPADNTRVLATQRGGLTQQGMREEAKRPPPPFKGFGGGGGFSGAGSSGRFDRS